MNAMIAALGALGSVMLFDGLSSPRPPARERSSREWLRAAGAGLATGSITLLATSSIAMAAVTAWVGGWIPGSLRARRARMRSRAVREGWPEVLEDLIASVRAGMSLAQACCRLAESPPEALREPWAAFLASYRTTANLATSLDVLRRAAAEPMTDRVVVALSLTMEVGGTDLVRALRALSDSIREESRTRREIEARWSWTVVAAKVAAAAPWIVLVLMSSRPEAARAYATSQGATVIAAGALATFAGYRLMLRAARLPEQRRL